MPGCVRQGSAGRGLAPALTIKQLRSRGPTPRVGYAATGRSNGDYLLRAAHGRPARREDTPQLRIAPESPAPGLEGLDPVGQRIFLRTGLMEFGSVFGHGAYLGPIDQRIVQALTAHPLTRTALRELIGVRNETLGVAIDRLVSAGRVVRIHDGLTVPVPV